MYGLSVTALSGELAAVGRIYQGSLPSDRRAIIKNQIDLPLETLTEVCLMEVLSLFGLRAHGVPPPG